MTLKDALQWQDGFLEGYFSTNKTYCRYSFFDINKPVVITFSMMGKYVESENINALHDIWGHGFVAKKGINVISFCCIDKASWYLDSELADLLGKLKKLLNSFPERLGYGGSMGGFGILAYYEILNLDRVLVMNPITTLDQDLVDFETRFKVHSSRLDWKFNYSDRASCQMNGYIVYDPLFELDKLHAKRLKGLQELKLPGVGHFMPVHLAKLGILRWLFESFYFNLSLKEDFYKKARKRRQYPQYYSWLKSQENKYLTPRRNKIINLHQQILKLKLGSVETVPRGAVNKVRDYAISLEDVDIDISLQVMKLAKNLRPHGQYISKKVREYEVRCKT